jgi:RHS repeat-associated protein
LWLLFALVAPQAFAQLAPTGAHYAGRPSDTGYGGTFVNATGALSAVVPLDLPLARGGLPIPLQISYTGAGGGAAGLGWDVPLSYVQHDSTLAHRRPVFYAGVLPRLRERATLSLLGQRADLLHDGDTWVARTGTLEIAVRQSGDTWLAYDGNGRTYSFVRPPQLGATGLWLLQSISGPDNTSVRLTYQVQAFPFNGASAISIDLVQIDYNYGGREDLRPHGCAKHEISLSYGQPVSSATPLSLSVLGDKLLVRQRTLLSVAVKSRAGCRLSFENLRRYELQYGPDTDTQLPRLMSVRMFGRQGTPEENMALPVANYQYGSATEKGAPECMQLGVSQCLHYQKTATIPIPADASAGSIAGTAFDSSVQNPGSASDFGYAMWQTLIDVNGDGRPDLVFQKNDRLWVAYNRPASDGSTTLGVGPQGTVQLSDATFANGAFSTHTAVKTRFQYGPAHRNTVNVWRQAIDVNGDGRIDIVDAAEEPDRWVVYLNTPGPTGVVWQRRSFSVAALRAFLESTGHHLDGPYVPLSRRSTGVSLLEAVCWRWDGNNWQWFPWGIGRVEGCPGVPDQALQYGPEQTFVEWDFVDLNGDGFPDFVFDTEPVKWQLPRPPTPLAKDRYIDATSGGNAWFNFGLPDPSWKGRKPINEIRVAWNVAGVRFDVDLDVFARDVILWAPREELGVGLWVEGAPDYLGNSRQSQLAGFADVNGDGLMDRVVNQSVYLGLYIGTAKSFSTTAVITLPGPLSTTLSTYAAQCKPGAHKSPESYQIQGMRDLTGDGIPDFYSSVTDLPGQAPQVWIGTGAGFVGPIPISSPTTVWSHQTEDCQGLGSWTVGGLFDIDGDGRPEMLTSAGSSFSVFQLAGGQAPGRPEAGRLTQIDNGYGAVTHISYASAKQHTDNSVPFPENVVTAVTTTAVNQLGGSLAGTGYAYGNAELVFDSALDRFVFPGYGRTVEVDLFGQSGPPTPSVWPPSLGQALIIDRWPLGLITSGRNDARSPDPAFTTVQYDRWRRERRVGQVRDVISARVVGEDDPWLLLNVSASNPALVFGVTHYDWDVKLYQSPLNSNEIVEDCSEMMFYPYDYGMSLVDPYPVDECRFHGFAFPSVVWKWRGSAPPPSDQNVQTSTRVLSVDDFGQPLRIQFDNDVTRPDDDLCVDDTYATPPSGTFPRVTRALAQRRISPVCGKDVTIASDIWTYDSLPFGSVTNGRVTSHDVEQHATDDGALLNTIHAFDASYDQLGNLSSLRTSRDSATRTVSYQYDPFGLAHTEMRVDATGVPPTFVLTTYDPISLDAIRTTDVNGTVRGVDFDGFERPIRSTLTLPAAGPGVLSTTSYLGFDGADPAGRRVSVTGFADPVDPSAVATASARTGVLFLDELGRPRRAEVSLGTDYPDQTLVLGARTYDGMGRVAFAADTFPKSQDPATAYGTTYYFTDTGNLDCAIRGSGPQTLVRTSDLAAERFPICLAHRFASSAETVDVYDASSLQAGSPQDGVARRTVRSAIGWSIELSTVSSLGARLQDATFSYDHLGRLASITRYLSPSDATSPTQWTRRLDSQGQVIEFSEPEAPTRFYRYSDWGEPVEVRWTQGGTTAQLLQTFDALGRISALEERNTGVTDPETVNTFVYDAGINVTPLVAPTFVVGKLARASSPHGDVTFSYDALGRTTAQVFTDLAGELYVEKTAYHADGRLDSLEFDLPDRNYDKEVAHYSYDSANRLQSISYTDSSGTVPLYNADTIDVLGRVRAAHYGTNTTFHANYANSGRRLITESGITSPLGSRRIAFGLFDALERETSRQEFVDGATGGVETDFSYNTLGELAAARQSNGAATLFDWRFGYDAQGNVAQLIDGTHQAADVLLGNEVADRDRLCRINYGLLVPPPDVPCNVANDALGNVLTEPTQTASRQFTYFASGRVRTISDPNAQATFTYGPFGVLQALDIHGTPTQEWHQRRYGSLIDQRDIVSGGATQTVTSRSIPAGGTVASRRGGAGNWIFEFGETRGNRFFTNQDGAFVQAVDYQPFGAPNSQGATPDAADYTNAQWNGGDALAAFNLFRLGARIYDPLIGRFLSRDPLVLSRSAGASNPYAFAANDPVNGADPTGLDDWSGGYCTAPEQCFQTPINPFSPSGGGGGASPTAGPGGSRPVLHPLREPLFPGGPRTVEGAAYYMLALSHYGRDLPPRFGWDSYRATGASPSALFDAINQTAPIALERDAAIDARNANLNSAGSYLAGFGDAVWFWCPGCARYARQTWGITSGDADPLAYALGSITGIVGLVVSPSPTTIVRPEPTPPRVLSDAELAQCWGCGTGSRWNIRYSPKYETEQYLDYMQSTWGGDALSSMEDNIIQQRLGELSELQEALTESPYTAFARFGRRNPLLEPVYYQVARPGVVITYQVRGGDVLIEDIRFRLSP